MLELVVANRFDRSLMSGKTRPSIITGLKGSDEAVELVVKFSAGCERGVGGLACEAICSMLAGDLGLPTPEAYLVNVEPEFIAQVPDIEIARIARRSSSVAFGSQKLPPGFSTIPRGMPLPKDTVEMATEIFAFDCIVQNTDRLPRNPNCLRRGNEFALIDHELAFTAQNVLGWKAPWVSGGLEMFKPPDGHLFAAALKGKVAPLDRLIGAMQSISDTRLHEYRKAMPAAWASARQVVDDALEHLRKVRDNIETVAIEVYKVLA